jgi:hypothetical protein
MTPPFSHESVLLAVGLRQVKVWHSKSNGFAYVLSRLRRSPAATCMNRPNTSRKRSNNEDYTNIEMN